MNEFDLLVIRLQLMLKQRLVCEDGEIYINDKKGLAYEVYNLVEELDAKFIRELKKELECND